LLFWLLLMLLLLFRHLFAYKLFSSINSLIEPKCNAERIYSLINYGTCLFRFLTVLTKYAKVNIKINPIQIRVFIICWSLKRLLPLKSISWFSESPVSSLSPSADWENSGKKYHKDDFYNIQ
jgi:hypothetical protein